MKTRFLIGAAVLASGIATTSQAAGPRALIYDDIIPVASTSATSQTVSFADFGGFSFSVAPGVTPVPSFLGQGVNIGGTFYEINWGGPDPTAAGGIQQQVAFITPSLSGGSANTLTVDFNYAQPGGSGGGACGGASLSVGGLSFSSGNPCSGGGGNNEFKFSDAGGVLSLLSAPTNGTDSGSNWTQTSSGSSSGGGGGSSSGGTASAPEIDAKSAISGIALLLGSLAVMLGRSRQRVARRI